MRVAAIATPRVRISKAHSIAHAKKDSLVMEETAVKVCAKKIQRKTSKRITLLGTKRHDMVPPIAKID